MKSGKPIDVSKSSLVSLKAELVRKQEEAQKSKGSESYVKAQPKKKKEIKTNPGVEQRKQKDEISQEEVDLLQKSREVLEVKARLYDKLEAGESVQENIGDPYLVDFKEKLDKVFKSDAPSTSHHHPEDESEGSIHEDDYDDDGWVDYTDCLGRTRRCLKEDVAIIKEKDTEMSRMLGAGTSQTESISEPIERPLEMISADMERQRMREKWEQQEQLLLNKKNIYYEDIRFDEARSHGVAYYNFSTDETKREEEQAEFKRVREETMAKQKEAKEAKERREIMKQTRLIAARNRQRARLGLPPLSVELEAEEKKEETKEEEASEDAEESTQDLETALARAAHVRPWDIGKDGVKQPDKVMTQEEWVEKKRQERPQEFAPPDPDSDSDIGPPVPFAFTQSESKPSTTPSQPFRGQKRKETFSHSDVKKRHGRPLLKDDAPRSLPPSVPSTSKPTRTRAEIPPPPSFDYYTSSRKSSDRPKDKTSKEMIDSIEAGLEFLRKQAEEREKKVKDVE